MQYSLAQQVVRQDVRYYLTYACLRPDRNARLIAFPYYAKSHAPLNTLASNITHWLQTYHTGFKHIDINIANLAHNHAGINIIQGSVSTHEISSLSTCMD